MALSPMMKQYLKIKEDYKDTILFYRLGDFYEMFFDDAIMASRELDLVLTGRDCGLADRAPMCGIPYHAASGYMYKLIDKGYKVAICEQITEPGAQKGIVERSVVKVVTPGTVTDSNMLSEKSNNYLASVFMSDKNIGIAWSDITTGETGHSLIEGRLSSSLNELLSRLDPAEIICNSEMLKESINLSIVKFGSVCPFSAYGEDKFDHKNAYIAVSTYFDKSAFGMIKDKHECISAMGALLSYIEQTQKKALMHLSLNTSENTSNMIIDSAARKTLELLSSAVENKVRGSLLWVIDKTCTGMGARTLKKWIGLPLCDVDKINLRLNSTEEFLNKKSTRENLRVALSRIKDIERIAGRISGKEITPRECVALGSSLKEVPAIKNLLSEFKDKGALNINSSLREYSELVDLIGRSISEEPPALLRDGGYIRAGYDSELDSYRNTGGNSKAILARLEAEEKEETGIKNLRIGFNKVFGYYIEVSKSQLSGVPYRYIRKQTIAGGERFITEELKELESKILGAEESAISREQVLYNEIVGLMGKYVAGIIENARALGELDCLLTFAVAAAENNYCKPAVRPDIDHIKITEGRHPVVEKILKTEQFVPNDTYMNDDSDRMMLITGPNMAGKSIYMKQVAIITILAHIGCFVPAKSAEICLIDKVFTRVGASDDLATGRSTFMVEMSETCNILSNATKNSLILLDELGRGTSTYDGMSIAYAVLKYISAHIGCKTLFSTHYHELTELEGVMPGLKNYHIAVRELNGDIVFMHKLLKGAAGKSYGIEVAKLAALPKEVIEDARNILKHLEHQSIGVSVLDEKAAAETSESNSGYPPSENPVISKLQAINTDLMSPMEALNLLANLKKEAIKFS